MDDLVGRAQTMSGEGKMGLLSASWNGGADDAAGADEEEDELNEDGVLFYVNKSGCPMDDRTWNRMWDHVAKIHPDGYSMIYKIRDKTDLPEVTISLALPLKSRQTTLERE